MAVYLSRSSLSMGRQPWITVGPSCALDCRGVDQLSLCGFRSAKKDSEVQLSTHFDNQGSAECSTPAVCGSKRGWKRDLTVAVASGLDTLVSRSPRSQ